ncbi:Membrane protein [Gossypium australe]|uniref:Membrane protein n=1 Tax=Gossypium australe TaxID=47621 RepID=A0A5B6WJA7_9ROSI|nr:Membrane protein [Gossypium australe]
MHVVACQYNFICTRNDQDVSELKTKLGHVIVMLLLIGFFDKCKKAVVHSTQDLLCFSASVLLSSSCLFLLSKLNGST